MTEVLFEMRDNEAMFLRHIVAVGFAFVLAGCATSDRAVRVEGVLTSYRLLGEDGPTVVLESGRGEGMGSWDAVAHALSECTRVVLYERPHLPTSQMSLASDVARRLHSLLEAIDAKAPFILVGHSLGGLYVQAFARQFPQTVGGVVLADSASPFEPEGVFVSTVLPPPGSRSAAEEAGFEASVVEMRSGPPFPPVPLIVIAATEHGDTPAREALWLEIQTRASQLSPLGQVKVASGSGHVVQSDRPDLIIGAVMQIVRAMSPPTRRCVGEG